MPGKSDSLKENKRLKAQLEIAQHELALIKGSRGYRAVRLLGYARKQLKHSPIAFSKKVIKKALSASHGVKSATYISKNLSSVEELAEQYREWILFNEPDQIELESQKKIADSFRCKPLVSIITPVFDPPLEVLRDLLETVLDQTYPYFELCLGNFGTKPEIALLIDEYCQKDSRVKTWSFKNEGIAANSNQLLKKAKGEYLALLDHDDTLSPDALFENVKLLNEKPYDFIYSDKDKIDEVGNRFEPFFKPDWSPEIMLNANYLTHLNLMRTSIVREVGGWSSDTDGAQDWDIFLKVIAHSKLIGHIPKVLYHWRVISTSTAMSIETKPYALEGQRNAVDRYMHTEGIKATSYHHGAELLLEWEKTNSEALFIVKSNSFASLLKFMAKIRALQPEAIHKNSKWLVVHPYEISKSAIETPKWLNVQFVKHEPNDYLEVIKAYLLTKKVLPVVFIDDRLDATTLAQKTIEELTGWLGIRGVVVAAPRVVEQHSEIAIEVGAFITDKGIKPIFYGSPPYHQSPIGNIEWVRDLKVASSLCFVATSSSVLKAVAAIAGCQSDDFAHTALQLKLSSSGRLVFNPKAFVRLLPQVDIDIISYYGLASVALASLLPVIDPYSNPNLSPDNPMNLTKIVQGDVEAEEEHDTDDIYQREALIHALNTSLTLHDLATNREYINRNSKLPLGNIQQVLFILPGFQAIYAGLNNIFSYADFLRQNNIEVSIALILEERHLAQHIDIVKNKFPTLAQKSHFYAVTSDSVSVLPTSDIAICTQWATAYILAKYNRTKRKCYFIQDKEASFYPKGTISALVENTYRMGFYGLANTPGLLDWYRNEYGGSGVVIKSKVSLETYSPNVQKNIRPQKPYKVFFYARPNEPRNAFELGVAALVKLKERLKDEVEIYAAGAEWEPTKYGLEDVVTCLGKISYDKLPAFYRSMDAGLMFMFSGHPGVVASELMASGCPVVVNWYDDVTWNDLYKDGETCIVSVPTAAAVADSLEKCLTDTVLRQRIINGGLKKVKQYYKDYELSCHDSLEALEKPLNA